MSQSPETGVRVIGSMRAQGGRGTVRMEDTFRTDIDDLWSAVTEPERLSRWIATVSGDLRVGGEFSASFTSGWDGTGRVEVCEPPRRLVVTTSMPGEDATTMEAILSVEPGGTRLVVEERGLPLGEVAAHGAGWQAHVEDLAAHLAGRPASDWEARWTELSPVYSRMPIEGSEAS